MVGISTWTPEQDRLLGLLAGKASVSTIVARLAEVGPPKSRGGVYMRASRRLISLRKVRRRPERERGWSRSAWEPPEERALRELAGTMTAEEIAAELNRRFATRRGEGSVRKRAFHLGLSLRLEDRLTMLDMVRIFPAHGWTVKAWVDRGLLVAAKRGEGRKGSEWRFTTADVEAFVRAHPYLFPWQWVEPGRWQDLARACQLRDPWLSAKEAAALLGLHPNTVRGWFRQGAIPGAVRVGDRRFGMVRIPSSALPALERLAVIGCLRNGRRRAS